MCVRDEAVRGRVAWEQGTAGTAGTEGNSKSYSPVLGFPKTTFRFDDSLEGLTEPRNLLYSFITVTVEGYMLK